MNLVAYSDSEGSDSEATPAPAQAAKPAAKPAFQKVVDRSNPGKIKLNLPGVSHPQAQKDAGHVEGPPAKKQRMGGGAFGGLNAMLPAPKKPNVSVAATATATAPSGKRALGKGLGAGVSLRTGSEPAFRRERAAEQDDYDKNETPIRKEALNKEDFRAMFNLPPAKTEVKTQSKPKVTPEGGASGPATKSKPKLLPLSVARMKKKQPAVPKPVAHATDQAIPAPSSTAGAPLVESKPTTKPKVSLFSMTPETDSALTVGPSSGNYQPLLYGADEDEEAQVPAEAFEGEIPHASVHQPAQHSTLPGAGIPMASNDLTSIASELNLSDAERRQLFGRKGQAPDHSSNKIINFNTDAEYAHNEVLRQQGETIQHNALRSITGTGKNSLKSLISVAVSQKDALEEHFAAGHRNKREAGSKYGW